MEKVWLFFNVADGNAFNQADAATAQKYAEKAYAGGAFSSVDDNAFIAFDNANGYSNPNASALQVPEDFSQVRWSKPLMDFLKAGKRS
jgi:hypothetical protein